MWHCEQLMCGILLSWFRLDKERAVEVDRKPEAVTQFSIQIIFTQVQGVCLEEVAMYKTMAA